MLDQKETEEEGGGLFRIEVNLKIAPYTWEDYKKLSGEHPKMLKQLYKTAMRCGARPDFELRLAFEPVNIEFWIDIEK